MDSSMYSASDLLDLVIKDAKKAKRSSKLEREFRVFSEKRFHYSTPREVEACYEKETFDMEDLESIKASTLVITINHTKGFTRCYRRYRGL